MMISRNGVNAEKKDLHVGGVGSTASAGLATIGAPMAGAIEETTEDLLHRAQDWVRRADDYVHDNPWAAVGLVAVAGLTAGYLLSRRF